MNTIDRNVVRDVEAKLHKQHGLLQELLDRNQILQQEIDTLQAQVAAAANPCQGVSPMHPPGWASLGVELERFWHHHAKRWRKRLTSRRPLERWFSAEAETRASVFAEAGMPCAREPTRLVEECSALAKGKASKEKVEGSSGERSVPSATIGR